MDIHVRIDRLVLEGVTLPAGGGAAVGAALEAELGRLLAAGGLAEGWQAVAALPRLTAGPVSLAGSPVDLGVGIARSVYGGLGPAGGAR